MWFPYSRCSRTICRVLCLIEWINWLISWTPSPRICYKSKQDINLPITFWSDWELSQVNSRQLTNFETLLVQSGTVISQRSARYQLTDYFGTLLLALLLAVKLVGVAIAARVVEWHAAVLGRIEEPLGQLLSAVSSGTWERAHVYIANQHHVKSCKTAFSHLKIIHLYRMWTQIGNLKPELHVIHIVWYLTFAVLCHIIMFLAAL